MEKIRIGIHSISCCGGCQLELIESEIFMSISEKIEIIYLSNIEEADAAMDICLVTGKACTDQEINELKKIRERTRVLVAVGACAVTGGIGKEKGIVDLIKIEYIINGCPIDKSDLLQALAKILSGRNHQPSSLPVCAECRENELQCRIKIGEACLGPVTIGGCNAICPANASPCVGCRGRNKEGNIEALKKIGQEETASLFSIFGREKTRETRDAGTKR
jgi:sulfhydrogenase subunit delta